MTLLLNDELGFSCCHIQWGFFTRGFFTRGFFERALSTDTIGWHPVGQKDLMTLMTSTSFHPQATNRKAWLWWRPATLSATYINPAATTTHDAKQTRNKTCNRRRHPLRRHLQRRCVWTRTWTGSCWILRLIASTIITPLSFQEAIWPCAHGQDCRHIVSRSKLLYLSCFALRSNTHKLFASTYKIDSISMNTTLLSLNLHYSSTSELTG